MNEYPQSPELLRRAQAGDELAFERVLSRLHSRLLGCIREKIPSASQSEIEAEDVCQETYSDAARELGRCEFASEDALVGWLLTIANRRMIDMIRAITAEKRGGGLNKFDPSGGPIESTICLLEQLAVDSRTPSQTAARREVGEVLRAGLDRLPGDQRSAVRMRYLDGLSLEEAASKMGRSIGAVAMLCRRGLERLSEHLSATRIGLAPSASRED